VAFCATKSHGALAPPPLPWLYQGRGTPPHHRLCGEAALLTAALECAASVFFGKVERPFLSLRVIKFSVGDGCFL
jgi:hypothetical protein